MNATAQCELRIQNGKVWCDVHQCTHPTSWDWEKHIKCNPEPHTHYENGERIPEGDREARIQPKRLPFRHVLYTGSLCHCGTILLDEDQ